MIAYRTVVFSREKGEVLDRGLIENLEELFGVGPHHHAENKTRFTIDEELPNVVLDNADKKAFDVEYGVSEEVINLMAKNLEGLDRAAADIGGGGDTGEPPDSGAVGSDRIIRIKNLMDMDPDGGPPPGALAKIVIVANRRLDQTRIVFARADGREQKAFQLQTADVRQVILRKKIVLPQNHVMQGCSSRGFWVEPEPFFLSGSVPYSNSVKHFIFIFLIEPKVF